MEQFDTFSAKRACCWLLFAPLFLVILLAVAQQSPAFGQGTVESRALPALSQPSEPYIPLDPLGEDPGSDITDITDAIGSIADELKDPNSLQPEHNDDHFQSLPLRDQLDSNGANLSQAEQPASGSVVIGKPSTVLDVPEALKIGMIAERGIPYLQGRIEPFRRYMQESLTMPVEIVAFRSMQALIAAHISAQIDYAIYPASTFAMAQASCGCLLPLVAPISSRAPEGIYMIMVVRGSSAIRSLADLTGRSMALSSKSGALPFHVALNALRQEGLDPDRDLSTLYSRDTPQDALSMLENGEVDAVLVWSTTQFNQSLFTSPGAISAYQEAKKNRRNKNPTEPDFLTIWRTRPVPAGPHVVHNQISKQQRAELIKALTAMKQRDPDAYDAVERFYDGGFRTVTLDHYAPLLDVATAQ